MAGNGFKIADAYVEVHLDTDKVDVDAQKLTSSVGKDMDRVGKEAGTRLSKSIGTSLGDGLDGEMGKVGDDGGSKIAQGFKQGFIRNSPLIVAAIGGALMAGGPLITGAMSVLMAGVAGVIVSQSPLVKNAFNGLWSDIKGKALEDASGLIPVFVSVASQIGSAFDAMRPQLRNIFDAVGPQIETVTTGLLGLVQNALPGLTRMIQTAGPVISGLASLLENVGTGLSDMFDGISQHATAGGQVFQALGDILGQLLPILGDLMGVGAEIAAAVLPPLAAALGVVRGALEFIAPILPVVVAGFAAFKIAQVAGGWLTSLSTSLSGVAQNLAFASYGTGPFATAAGGMSTAVSGASKAAGALSAALPIIGVVAAVAAIELNNIDQAAQDMATALRKGGDAADAARAQLSALNDQSAGIANSSLPDWFVKLGAVVGGANATFYDAAAKVRGTSEALKEQWAAMSPLEQATSKVSEWTATLAQRMSELGPAAKDTQVAQERLAFWTEKQAAAARLQQEAIHGSAIAMKDAADSADNLNNAMDKLNGGQLSLNEANRQWEQSIDDMAGRLEDIRKGTEGFAKTVDISTQAGRDNMKALDDQAKSASDVAEAYYKTTGDYDGFVQKIQGGRAELVKNAEALGMNADDANTYADSVLAIPDKHDLQLSSNLADVKAEVGDVVTQLKGVPNGKTINVGVISEQAFNTLTQMGYTVKALPDGTVEITANDKASTVIDGASAKTNAFAGQHATATIGVADEATGPIGAAAGKAAEFGNMKPTPVAGLDKTPFDTGIAAALAAGANLHSQRPTPVSNIENSPLFSGISTALSWALGLHMQRPTPISNINNAPLQGGVASALSSIFGLHSQRPTPVAELNSGNVFTMAGSILGSLFGIGAQRPTPIITASNQTGGGISAAQAAINSVRDKTVTITTILKTITQFFKAGGGLVGDPARQHFDGGGKVRGPGGPTEDKVPAMLSDGEFVIRAAMVDKYGVGFLTAVNAGAVALQAAGGGVAAAAAGSYAKPMGYSSAPAQTVDTGPTYHVGAINVSIPAKDLAEMRDIQDFFNRVGQEARRTSLTGAR